MFSHVSISAMFTGSGMKGLLEARYSIDELRSMEKCLGSSPMYTTLRMNTLLDNSGDQIASVVNELNKKDPGTFRVDCHPVIKDLLIIQNKGPFQRTELPRVAVVDRFCGVAVMRGADIYVQGILAMSSGIQAGDCVSVYVDILGRCLKGSYPDVTGMYHVGNGISQLSRDQVFSPPLQTGVGIRMNEPIYHCPSLNNFLPGVVFPQNLPSALCAHVLNPQPGDTVFDMCAAPGGKTTHIGELMKNQGILVALDKAAKKIDRLRETLERWGVTNARVYHYDGSKTLSNSSGAESPTSDPTPPYPPSSFDRILVDAPCSALGQRPCLTNPSSASELASFPVLQRRLLDTASRLLKVGGTLVYSTCTFLSDENEEQVAKFLKRHPKFQLRNQGDYHLAGDLPYKDADPLAPDQMKLLQRFYPAHLQGFSPETDTIGFFIAKFHKTS